MKKIGILTFHFCKNYGALLQCFALNYFLKSQGYEAKVINAVSEKQANNNSLFRCKNGVKRVLRNIVLFPLVVKRVKQDKLFKEFVSDYLDCTELCANVDELELYLNKSCTDAVVVGSDQVWNIENHDFDEMFMLPFHSSCRKIGYAVSIGTCKKELLMRYDTFIQDFDCIMLREYSTKAIFREVAKLDLSVVVDPVLLLNRKQWEDILYENPGGLIREYLVCYFINKKNFGRYYKYAKAIAKKRKLKIKIINASYNVNSYASNSILDIGPVDFMKLIKHAKYVCTDSFHGTVFSTIFEKDFITFVDSDKKGDTRVSDYLLGIGLESRLLYSADIDYARINDMYKYNWEIVEEKMENSSKISAEELIKAIEL